MLNDESKVQIQCQFRNQVTLQTTYLDIISQTPLLTPQQIRLASTQTQRHRHHTHPSNTSPPSQPKSLHPPLQIHHIIRPRRLAPPHHLPPPIHRPSPRLLPLIPHHRRRPLPIQIRPHHARPIPSRYTPRRRLPGSPAAPPQRPRHARPQPPLLLEPGHRARRVQHVPHAPQAEPPRGVDGAVLVDDYADVPRAAEEGYPLLRGGGGGVRDGEAGKVGGEAGGDGAELEEGFLCDWCCGC